MSQVKVHRPESLAARRVELKWIIPQQGSRADDGALRALVREDPELIYVESIDEAQDSESSPGWS